MNKKEKEPEEVALSIHRFPVALRKRMNVRAAQLDLQLREAFIEACEKWLAKNGKKG